ncbi:MAG TPA: DNA adenine methylase [Patescibacteria group bacterium]|nr:DNA adenine methylase [Patescibacteria group bacterium]
MYGPFSYIGGKRMLAPRILELFPAHKAYIEPFAGGAQVFFRKEPSKVEVLNDLDHEIVNFYRICQQHYEELVRYLRFTVVSRHWFDLLNETDPKRLTDIQRAARHLYLAKTCFAGLVRHRNFVPHVVEPPGFNPERIPALIEEAHERLSRVQLECLPYEDVLKVYDRPTSLFYLDPPYYGRKLYRYNLDPKDFATMAERLGRLKGKFILSLNDLPEVRALFKGFHIRPVELAYTTQKIAGRRYAEVLITNF